MRRRSVVAVALVAVAAGLAATGGVLLTDTKGTAGPPAIPGLGTVPSAVRSATPPADLGAVPAPLPTPIDRTSPLAPIVPGHSSPSAPPVEISIPAIGVHAAIVDLVRGAGGVLEPPVAFDTVGWYAAGVTPGAVGPALLAGHVDSQAGPAVFWKLSELTTGQTISITRADRSLVRFEVSSVSRYPKAAFPTDAVYGPQVTPVLRLVTCGGTFDAARGHYRDNVVVFADLIGT